MLDGDKIWKFLISVCKSTSTGAYISAVILTSMSRSLLVAGTLDSWDFLALEFLLSEKELEAVSYYEDRL